MAENDPHTGKLFHTLLTALPAGVDLATDDLTNGFRHDNGELLWPLLINNTRVVAAWIGAGTDADLGHLAALGVDLLVGSRLNAGVRSRATDKGLSWIDATGAADIRLHNFWVIKPATPVTPPPGTTRRWTTSMIGVAEAILAGVDATVSAINDRAGISVGAASTSLAALTDMGLLATDAHRGRYSGRRVVDAAALLDAYAVAVQQQPAGGGLAVGLIGDLLGGLRAAGERWDDRSIGWALTGIAGASLLAPAISEISTVAAYVDAPNDVALERIADYAGLRPIEGGRLTLRPFPRRYVAALSAPAGDRHRDGLRVAAWPRVYAETIKVGVRGQEAAYAVREKYLQTEEER